jgi:hypothetical protein
VPLILAYFSALLAALWAAWKIARQPISGPNADLAIWGALLLAYNTGAVAATFNGAFFIGQSGMEFWLLNGALFATVAPRGRQRGVPADMAWNTRSQDLSARLGASRWNSSLRE